MASPKDLRLGILAGISTGVFWGIPFLVPQLLPGYTALEIAFGRFAFFGLISFLFIGKVQKVFLSLARRDRYILFFLSASGFWFYSTLLFWGVQKTGGVISSIIIGLLPLSIPLCSRQRKISGTRFYWGLGLLFAGLINLFGYPAWVGTLRIRPPPFAGVLALLVCLALWTGFAIANSEFLKRNDKISRKDFTSVMGAISFLSIVPLFLARVNLSEFSHREHFTLYLICASLLGLGSSWLANWLWNICSFHCPSEISGPLIVSETVFGLLYTFISEHRAPRVYESISIFLFLGGVTLAVTSQMRSAETKTSSPANNSLDSV